MRNGTPWRIEDVDRLVEPVERARLVGDRHDLDAPVDRALAVGRVDAQDQVGPGGDGRGDLDRVEAVDRDAMTPVAQGRDRVADPAPGSAGVAAQVDPIGPFGGVTAPPRRGARRGASRGAWLISARISMSKAP